MSGDARKTAEGLTYLTGSATNTARRRSPALPHGRNAPQRALGLYAGAAERHGVHGAEGAQPAFVAVPGSVRRPRTRRSRAGTTGRCARRPSRRPSPTRTGCAGTRCRSRRGAPTSSRACGRWAATATRPSAGMAVHLYHADSSMGLRLQ